MDKENIKSIITAFIYLKEYPQIIKEIEKFQKELNEYVDSVLSSQKSLACKKGCFYCCVGWEVKLTFAETFLFIKNLNTLENFQKEKIANKLERFKNFHDENTPCPFLDSGLCSVYQSRPFVCRTFSSYDENLCKNKITFKFPDFIEDVILNIKQKIENEITNEFISLFNTKISIKNIKYDRNKSFFYVDIFNIFRLSSKGEKILIEPLAMYKKMVGDLK